MGPDGTFINGSDILVDGGVAAAYWYGELAEVRNYCLSERLFSHRHRWSSLRQYATAPLARRVEPGTIRPVQPANV